MRSRRQHWQQLVHIQRLKYKRATILGIVEHCVVLGVVRVALRGAVAKHAPLALHVCSAFAGRLGLGLGLGLDPDLGLGKRKVQRVQAPALACARACAHFELEQLNRGRVRSAQALDFLYALVMHSRNVLGVRRASRLSVCTQLRERPGVRVKYVRGSESNCE